MPVAVVTVILLRFEYAWAFKFRTRNENPFTGGEKVKRSEPYVARMEFCVLTSVATKYMNTLSSLHANRAECCKSHTHIASSSGLGFVNIELEFSSVASELAIRA